MTRIISIILMVVMLLPNSFVMLKDTALMGIDYIDLTRNSQKVTAADVKEAVEHKTDSRIFVLTTDGDFAKLKEKYETREDPKLNEYFDYVKECADKIVPMDYVGYVYDDEEDSILEAARAVLERVICLSFMWRMTGDETYANRCKQEMADVCAFEDWHESHFLDVAELTFSVALGTNWLYDYLTESEKAAFADAVKTKAFDVSEGKIVSQNWWKWSKTNWNSVCYGGLATAAAVFYDYYPDYAADFLAEAYRNLAINFETYTPDGVYVEGSGYWEYCTTYLTYFLSTSENFIGTDFGLSDIDGFLELGAFPLYITGAAGVFNYGDNKRVSIGAPSLYWFSKKTGNPAMAYYQAKATVEEELKNGKGEFELARECAVGALWYDAALLEGYTADSLPLSVHLNSDRNQELVIMRSDLTKKDASYAAIKAGYNYTNHGDLDIGTFVFDSGGVRWAEDLGPADYGNSGYFVGICGGGRWRVYAKRAEGQNTLVINPNKIYEDQYPFARASFTDFEANENGGKAVLDMSDAYKFVGALDVKREFEMYRARTALRVKDTFTCAYPSEVYWFMHTKADITVVDAHTAILTLNGQQMKATLSENSVGEFKVTQPESLLDGMDNRLKGNWDGLKKLTVYADGVMKGSIEVRLEPVEAPRDPS